MQSWLAVHLIISQEKDQEVSDIPAVATCVNGPDTYVPLHTVELDDDGEVIVEEHFPLVCKANLESILVLELPCLQVSEDSSSWEVVCKPMRYNAYQLHNDLKSHIFPAQGLCPCPHIPTLGAHMCIV